MRPVFLVRHWEQKSQSTKSDKMGRIKTKKIKSITKDLMALHGDDLTDNFEKYKELVERFSTTSSKKLRNVIAGYCARLIKNREVL